MRLRDPVDTACRFLVPRISALSGGISSNEKNDVICVLVSFYNLFLERNCMMEAAGVTEELKARDPIRWVGLMNTLKAQVEEMICQEFIYI